MADDLARAPKVDASGSPIRTIDHVGIAVRDLEAALALFRDALGGTFVTGGDNDVTGIRLAQLALGGFKVELLQPLRADSFLAGTMQRRGEGIHHVTFLVDGMAGTVSAFDEAGVPTVGTDTSSSNWQETFVRPSAAGGALIQLAATVRDWSKPVDGVNLERVLAGQCVFQDNVPSVRHGAVR